MLQEQEASWTTPEMRPDLTEVLRSVEQQVVEAAIRRTFTSLSSLPGSDCRRGDGVRRIDR